MSRLGELTRKVDAFFARVAERHGTDMQCGTGCSDCCHVQLTITGVEAAAIRALVAGWPAERRHSLAIGPTASDRCAALDPAGRCKIYEARPLVCRSHGVPIRMRQGSLPVVQACHRNFTRTTPDPDCILDQATLSATLYAVDAAEARAAGPPRQLGDEPRDPSGGLPAAEGAATQAAGVAGAAGAPTARAHALAGPGYEPGRRIELAGLLADLAAI